MNYESRSTYRPVGGEGENLSFTSTSAQSATRRGGVYSLCPTQTCYIRVGANPTATVGSGSMRIPADTLVYITLHKDEKIAAIRETTDGILNIALQQ
jgi:hypothetical protein